jgi:hypothetical protein
MFAGYLGNHDHTPKDKMVFLNDRDERSKGMEIYIVDVLSKIKSIEP